jgi:hypothetical protein
MSATTPTAAEMERLRVRQQEDANRQQRVETEDSKLPVPRTPAEEAEFRHQQEEQRMAKQAQYDPKIHGAGTVTPVEPQSVRDMFQYYLALEARVKELEVGAEEAAKSRQVNKYPNHNPTAADNPLTPVRLSTNQPAAVAEVEESGGTQTGIGQAAEPSPYSPHK